MNNSYPTVATIIGCPEELKSTDGLVATPLVIDGDMNMPNEPSVEEILENGSTSIKDPVKKAIVDNILGKNPTKATLEKHKCELCKVEVNGKAALLTHLGGSKHAKRLKEEDLNRESQSPFIKYEEPNRLYSCTLCNTTMNARIQIMAHLQGSKHRGRLTATGKTDPVLESPINKVSSTTSSIAVKKKEIKQPGSGPGNVGQHFCSTCKIHTNSEVQLQQHVSSKKHLNKVGSVVGKGRPAPYTTRPRGGIIVPPRPRPLDSAPSTPVSRRREPSSYLAQPYGQGYRGVSQSYVRSSVYSGEAYNSQQSYEGYPYQTHMYG